MNQITHVRRSPGIVGLLHVLASAVGCAPSLIALGSGLVAIGGISQQRFPDRGCVTKAYVK